MLGGGEFECRQAVFWGTGTKRLGTPVVEADLSGLGGWYLHNSWHWYGGADVCEARYVIHGLLYL